MDIISYGKAGKALRDVKKLDEQVVAPLAESRFPTVDARLDWLEGQADKIKVENSLQVDLSKGTFTDTEFIDGKIKLTSINGNLYYFQKYNKLVQYVLNDFVYSSSDKMTITGAPNYSFNSSTGAVTLSGSNITLGTGAGQTPQGTVYTLSGNILYKHVSTWSGTVSSWQRTIYKATISQTPVNQKGEFVETVTGFDGQYPDNGIASDNYWYVKENLVPFYKSIGSYESPTIDLGEGWHETKLVDVVKQVRSGGYTNNIIPTMTSNTAPSGEASASSINGSSWDAWRGFDGTTTAWMSNAAVAWIAYDFKEPKKIGKYTISGDSTTSRNPKKWTFEGWDGSSWVILDQQELDYILGVSDVEFMVDTPGFYTKYRINILLNNGATNSAIREIKMMELLPGTDSKLEISTSADGTTFNSYAPVDPAAPAQGRYVKIRATLSSQPQPAEVNSYQFDQAAENKVTLNGFTEAAGDLKLKKNYSYALEDVSVEVEGKIIQTRIPRTQFSKIHTLEVK